MGLNIIPRPNPNAEPEPESKLITFFKVLIQEFKANQRGEQK